MLRSHIDYSDLTDKEITEIIDRLHAEQNKRFNDRIDSLAQQITEFIEEIKSNEI